MPKKIEGTWIPIQESLEAANVPERTAWNWIRAKKIDSRKEGGRTLVLLEQLQDRAAARAEAGAQAAASAGAYAGAGASGGARLGTGAVGVSADAASRLFPAFERGEAPADLVVRLGLPPEAVRSAFTQWQALRELGPKPSPLDLKWAAIAEQVEQVQAAIGAWQPEFLSKLPSLLQVIAERLNATDKRVADLRALYETLKSFRS